MITVLKNRKMAFVASIFLLAFHQSCSLSLPSDSNSRDVDIVMPGKNVHEEVNCEGKTCVASIYYLSMKIVVTLAQK